MTKKLPQWLQGKSLEEQSLALAEQCVKAFDAHGIDASKLFSGLRVEWLGLDKPEYVRLADGEPILNVALLATAYLTDCYWDVKVQYDQNITGFVWTFTSPFGEPGSASLYPVQE